MSIYYPYFRGKQYELLAIRENAELLSAAKFVPIIEPVKENLKGLKRALDSIVDNSGHAIVIVNPFHGEVTENHHPIAELFSTEFPGNQQLSAGIILKNDMSSQDLTDLVSQFKAHQLTLIHAGFSDAKQLAQSLGESLLNCVHCFLDGHSGKLYQKHFANTHRVLIRDGFHRRPNRDHPTVEPFSDLHITYPLEGVDAFGDFLIVGDDYSESGGPAYTVAIHLTFIDAEKDDAMFTYHFLSERNDTPKDPAGKFHEALERLMRSYDSGDSKLYQTRALEEFQELYKRNHFPGLGYIKKLSMQHHIETLAQFFKKTDE